MGVVVNSRFWVILVALLWCSETALAMPRVRCSIQTSTSGGDAGFDDISIFGDGCDEVAVSTTTSTSSDGTTVSTAAVSSSGEFRPFAVAGGDEGVEIEDPEERVTEIETAGRPVGPWHVIIEARVDYLAHEAWIVMQNFGNVLVYGLDEYAANIRSLDAKGKTWIVDLESGEQITFNVTQTDVDKYFHVARIDAHGPEVFPGVDITGSLIFIQFTQLSDGHTRIEFGWGGPAQGPSDTAVTAVGSFGQQLVVGLEAKFGEICSAETRNLRTIEGDCNNLLDPRKGAAGHALVRLGGSDPSFPDGDPTHPAGPVHISPREISNKLCAQSPGPEVLLANTDKLEGKCFEDTKAGRVWRVCPYDSASEFDNFDSFGMVWNGMVDLNDGSMGMSFSGDECELEVILTCGGTAELVLMDDPCGNKGNRLFHPVACLIKPGQDDVLKNSYMLTDLFWTFGQFIDHDLGLTPVNQIADKKQPGLSKNSRSSDEELPIPVPKGDYYLKENEMEFERTTVLKDSRRGLHENQHSAFADLGQVYGVDYLRARALRSFSGGKLKVSHGDFPPFNKLRGPGALRAKVDNAPDAGDNYFAVGDIRGNEQTLLLAMHIIWLREHNQICDELAAVFPKWDDERLYQTARAIAIAEYQSIIYEEFLPLLLGEGVVASSDYVYDANVDPSLHAVFSTVAFRFGHTMVGSYLWQLGPGSRDTADLELVPLRNAFFKPEMIQVYGIDGFLRGAAWHICKEVDAKVVDELRNFLFTERQNEGHLDLVSLNIQRGRDMGIPSFNALRVLIGLPAYKSFYEFIEDEHLAAASDRVYEYNVHQCDALYGGFAEKAYPGSIVGETFYEIIKDQFTRIRDGDRFFYTGLDWDVRIVAKYPRINDIMARKVKLADVIVRNCEITYDELGQRTSGTIMKL